MRIAQVAPAHREAFLPPATAGPSESSPLTEELVRQGHEVTLFASGGPEDRRLGLWLERRKRSGSVTT